jgi:PAS domain S-box-containing protein
LAAEAAELGIWHWYPGEDRVTWENDRMFEILRRSKEEGAINAQEFSQQVIHPDDRARFERALAETVKGGKRFYNQSRARRTDGSVGWLEFTGQLESHHNGTPQRVLGTLMDITGRKRAQELEREMAAEALAATAKFRAVFEQTSVFAGIMTLEGVLIDANQMFLAACGYEAKNELGKPFWETSWWRNSKEVQDKIRIATQQAARGTAFRETLTYHWADGSERLVDFSLHPIRDAEGTILFLHPTGVDITDLKRAEENYRELAETLEEEVQARTKDLQQRSAEVLQQSEQLRELSHRLMQIQDDERRRVARELHDSAGQILTALSMNLSRIVRQTQKGEAVVEKDAQESQALVQELSKEIRTMSYLLHPPLLDECGLSEALQMYIRGLRERSGLQVSLHIAEDFGRLAPEMELVLFRIVQECLTNVHRHSESKVATIQISRTANSVVLKVKDEGKGIPPERLAQIQSQGAGVGVRGMRERVLQLNGKLDIQSGSAGTTITVTFPVRAGDAAPSTNQGISEGAGRPAPSLSSSRGSLT